MEKEKHILHIEKNNNTTNNYGGNLTYISENIDNRSPIPKLRLLMPSTYLTILGQFAIHQKPLNQKKLISKFFNRISENTIRKAFHLLEKNVLIRRVICSDNRNKYYIITAEGLDEWENQCRVLPNESRNREFQRSLF